MGFDLLLSSSISNNDIVKKAYKKSIEIVASMSKRMAGVKV